MKRVALLRRTPLRAKTALKGGASLERRTQLRATKPIAQRSKKARRGPPRDPAYLRWIRSNPCCVCGKTKGVIAHHMVEGDGDDRRGLSQKVSDYKTLPFCEAPDVAGSHHKQFHRRLRDFAGWSNERRREFQSDEIVRMQCIWRDIAELGVTQEPERRPV